MGREGNMPYKVGDVILITGKKRKKLAPILNRNQELQAALTYVFSIFGMAELTMWEALRKEYPEIFKDYEVAYHNFTLTIDRRKL